MYESKISNARWIAYDLPGNAGWISFLTALILCFVRQPGLLESRLAFALLLLELPCGAAMAVGIVELISERIQKLDRILPKKRLYRGFGALTAGGFAGTVLSLILFAAVLIQGMDGAVYPAVLCVGGLLCFLFSGLLLKEYKKKETVQE